MQKHTMIIDDQPGIKITDLRARARRMKEAYNIGFLAIDYLQLLSGSGNNRSQESRQIEISEISINRAEPVFDQKKSLGMSRAQLRIDP